MRDFVSIITVNYNGKGFLEDFLNSTRALDYSRTKFEVIVVDNASTDDSVRLIENKFSEVKIIKSDKNLGFGKGNNLGMKNAKGDLFYLVNNDTVLDQDALRSITNCYSKWSKRDKVGAINSKMVLFDRYTPIIVKGARFLNYKIPKEALPKSSNPFLFVHGKEKTYWEEIYLPYRYFYKKKLRLDLAIQNAGLKRFEILIGKQSIRGDFNIKQEPKALHLTLSPKDLEGVSVDFIQNAGNIVFRDGFGRDRGAVIINKEQYYEVDKGQYQKEEQIQAFCGAGVLLNKKAMDEVGYFDKNFFMYYEDTDLSLRFRKSGWKIVYCPDSVVRHIHAGSSKEWSPFFIFQVERNRLLMVSKHWPRIIAIKEWFNYFLRETVGFLYLYYHHGKPQFFDRFKLRLRVIISLAVPFLMNLSRMKRFSERDLKEFW